MVFPVLISNLPHRTEQERAKDILAQGINATSPLFVPSSSTIYLDSQTNNFVPYLRRPYQYHLYVLFYALLSFH
jgi:hypothetical protein